MDSVLHVLFHQSYGVLQTFVYLVNICLITVYPIRQGLHKFQQAFSALSTVILVVWVSEWSRSVVTDSLRPHGL